MQVNVYCVPPVFIMNSMFICPLCRSVDGGGAACRCGLDGGLLLPHPHHCGQGRQQKADKEPSMPIVTILKLAAYNKKK